MSGVLAGVLGTAGALAGACTACLLWRPLMGWAERGALQTDWDNMIYPATVMLAMLTDNQAFHTAAQGYLQKWLCRCLPPCTLFLFPPLMRP